MKRLMVVRHGESVWNAARKLQGQADIELSPRGREQARALRDTVAALKPDAVTTSDLKRAFDTALLLGVSDPQPTEALREIDVGQWTGRSIADIRSEDESGYQGWRAGTFTPPDGEAWPDFVHRTTTCVMDMLATCDRLLVVCHGGVVRAILEKLIELPPKRIIPVGPASLTVLAERPVGSGNLRLELFNYSPLGPVLDAPD